MTYTPFDPKTFLNITLPRIHPRPKDPYEAALHSCDLAYIFEECRITYLEQYHADLWTIRSENCQSREYRLHWPTKTTYTVNVEKLRQDHPDLHQTLVYLKAADAEKFLGRSYLYNAAREHAGDRITPYEKITIHDLKKHLAPTELPHYLTAKEHTLDPVILTAAEAL